MGGILAYDDTDYKSIDMLALFWTAIGFLIVYRLLVMCSGCCAGFLINENKKETEQKNEGFHGCLNCCLGLFDIYIFRVVYEALINEAAEPSGRQKFVQLLESIFESLPQVVLQSVFLIRAQNDEKLKENTSLILVGLSLGASIFSIANKFTWIDADCVDEDEEADFKTHWPFVNPWYILRVIWRYSFVTTRFAVFSLIWSVMGGSFLGIFIALSFFYWAIGGVKVSGGLDYEFQNGVDIKNCDDFLGACLVSSVYGSICLVSTPASDRMGIAIMHFVEMIVSLSLITWFAYDPTVDCGICANPEDRQAMNNDFIFMFLIVGWIMAIIDFIAYFLMLRFDRIDSNSDEKWSYIIRGFLEDT